jgi:hypothetical protein
MKRGEYWKRLGSKVPKIGENPPKGRVLVPENPDLPWSKKPLQEKICKTDLESTYTRIQLSMKQLPKNFEEAEWRSSIDVHNELLPYTYDAQEPERPAGLEELLPLPWLDQPKN